METPIHIFLSTLILLSPIEPIGISPNRTHGLERPDYRNPMQLLVSDLKMPETIRVRVTGKQRCEYGQYEVTVVDFQEYVKGVLSNEWGADWNEESLKAGAIAVKMYAWSLIERGGKWNDADVYDCDWDQVYNPNLTFPETDQAVEETWDYVLLDEKGKLYLTHYLAYAGACSNIRKRGQCMGQWDSLADAEAGMGWEKILSKYYEGSQLVKINYEGSE